MADKYPSNANRADFVELLAEGTSHSNQAQQAQLDIWISEVGLPFTTLRDPDGAGQYIIQNLSPRENTFLVERSSMKILARVRTPAQALAALDGL